MNLRFILLFFAYLIKGFVSPAPDNSQGLSPDMRRWVDNNHRLEWTRLPGTFHPNWHSRSLPDYSFTLNLASPQAFMAAHGRADLASHRPQPPVSSVLWKQEDLLKFARGHRPPSQGPTHHHQTLGTSLTPSRLRSLVPMPTGIQEHPSIRFDNSKTGPPIQPPVPQHGAQDQQKLPFQDWGSAKEMA